MNYFRYISKVGFSRVLLIPLLLQLATASATTADKYQQAVDTAKSLVHMQSADDVSPLIKQYNQLALPCCDRKNIQRYLFDQLLMQKWGVTVSDFEDLMQLLYSFETDDHQRSHRQKFYSALSYIEDFRHQVNSSVKQYHPGLQLAADNLRDSYRGKGQVIAVFDVFDDAMLDKQRQHYPQAKIESVQAFGDPVSYDHGNSVIDIILEIAPEANIVPVSSDSSHYVQAMRYIQKRDDVNIINMSRAFAVIDDKLDPVFANVLSEILKTKLVVKSLGNTGTDLDGVITPLRRERGLPATGNMFSYDLSLIKAFVETYSQSKNLLLAINLNLVVDNISLSTSIPGEHLSAQTQSLAMVADGIYTWSTDSYESGSSFAAPQLSAISALLWQSKTVGDVGHTADNIRRAIFNTSRNIYPLTASIIGQGLIDGDLALEYLSSQ